MQLYASASKVYSITIKQRPAPLLLSHSIIYSFSNFSLDTLSCPSSTGPCLLKMPFLWLKSSSYALQTRFVCTRLDGNVCGDYGIGWGNKSYPVVRDACYQNHVHKGVLDADNNQLAMHFWKQDQAESFNAKCFLWGSRNGALPSRSGFVSISKRNRKLIVSFFKKYFDSKYAVGYFSLFC